MSTKEPELRDFGITQEEYALYEGTQEPLGLRYSLVAVLLIAVLVGLLVGSRTTLGILIFGILPAIIVALLVESAIVRFKRSRLLKSPVASRIKLYEEARTAYEATREEAERTQREAERARREVERAQWEAESARRRKFLEHWMSLSGAAFERELATLYRRLGYRVESTPSSGDQGVDLVLRKDGKTTVVQCKGHQARVGPAVARELLGSMVDFGADSGILACTGGFTRGVKDFVRGKRIKLVSASDLATLGETAEGNTLDLTYSPPICPVAGCGKEMVLRNGRHGEFWGCPRFPRCRGTRRYS